jgi:hypothetical protein
MPSMTYAVRDCIFIPWEKAIRMPHAPLNSGPNVALPAITPGISASAAVAILLAFLHLIRVPASIGVALLPGAFCHDLDHKTPGNILAITVQFCTAGPLAARRSRTEEHVQLMKKDLQGSLH